MIDMASTGLRKCYRLANRPKQKMVYLLYYIHQKLEHFRWLRTPPTFLTANNQNIQKINRHFDGTLNNFFPIVISANQEQNESYTFKELLL